jgi:hypothetical protein
MKTCGLLVRKEMKHIEFEGKDLRICVEVATDEAYRASGERRAVAHPEPASG